MNRQTNKSIRLAIASDQTILSWSYGEVVNSILFDDRTGKPTKDGLFCPKIFGPINKNECLCNKPMINSNKCCSNCGTDFNINWRKAKQRFGHIELSKPIVHTWFHKTNTEVLEVLLGLSGSVIKSLINCDLHVINKRISDDLYDGKIINSSVYNDLGQQRDYDKVVSGGSAINYLLSKTNLNKLKQDIQRKYERVDSVTTSNELSERMKIIDGFLNKNVDPTWLVLKVLPVLPASLRPIVADDDEKVPSSDLNELYSQVITANNDLRCCYNLFKFGWQLATNELIQDIKKLQKAVDMLYDNSSDLDNHPSYNNEALKSISEMLKGKNGRFRQTLLGKRVDYSGRTVIVPGPNLKLDECSIPRTMAFDLFKPIIYLKAMLKLGTKANNSIESTLENNPIITNQILNEVTNYYPIILNRAPTLHKLSMLVFMVKLNSDRVIKVHPLVCAGYNADFDGDQMAIHVPLTSEAKLEAMKYMLSSKNILHPANGNVVITPTKEMIMGLYYLSLVNNDKECLKFGSLPLLKKTIDLNLISVHTKIMYTITVNNKLIEVVTTPGRILITDIVPSECCFRYDAYHPELTKELIIDLIQEVNINCDRRKTVRFCEALMRLGFKYATQSGLSLGLSDLLISKHKQNSLKSVRNKVREMINYKQIIPCKLQRPVFCKLWSNVADEINKNIDLNDSDIHPSNSSSIRIMMASGARGTLSQLQQLTGLRGRIICFNDELSKIPILHSYTEGLSSIEMFVLSYSSRKGLIDSVIKTSKSGYFMRKLVEASRECIIDEIDCRTKLGLEIDLSLDDYDNTSSWLIGRFLLNDVTVNNVVVADSNVVLTREVIFDLIKVCKYKVHVRSPLMCQANSGICRKCYGLNIGTRKLVNLGDSVGVLAAQSIGEPGTQLTLRSFHGLEISNFKTSPKSYQCYAKAPCCGQIKVLNLACTYSYQGDLIVVNNKCLVVIYQQAKLVWKVAVPIGSRLFFNNNDFVGVGKVLWLCCVQNESYISLANGKSYYDNLCHNVNLHRRSRRGDLSPTEKWGYTDKFIAKIILKVTNINLAYLIKNNVLSHVIIQNNCDVKIFDCIMFKIIEDYQDTVPNKSGGLYKLEQLFDNSEWDSDVAIVSPCSGMLKIGNTKGFSSYVIDPSSRCKFPIVYHLYDQHLNTKVDKYVNTMEMLLHGEVDLSDYAINHGFHCFVKYFIKSVQQIYEQYGINVNSKHIEVMLKLMTSTAVIWNDNCFNLTKYSSNKWWVIDCINRVCQTFRQEKIEYSRQVVGISKLCTKHQISPLSSMSYQGSTKAIVNAIINGSEFELTGIKDRTMFGMLPFIGLGYLKRC